MPELGSEVATHASSGTQIVQLEECASTIRALLLLASYDISEHPDLRGLPIDRLLDIYRAARKYQSGHVQHLVEGYMQYVHVAGRS